MTREERLERAVKAAIKLRKAIAKMSWDTAPGIISGKAIDDFDAVMKELSTEKEKQK